MKRPSSSSASGGMKRHGQLADVWKRLCKNRLAVFGLALLVLIVLVAIFADVIAPYAYDFQDYSATFKTPCPEHIFGTDNFGRDIFSRVVYGTRTSLKIAFISLAGSALVGCLLGAFAGFFGGVVDTLIMRFCDIMMAIPRMVLAISIATTLGPGLTNAMIAIAVSSVPNFARVVRASTLTVRDQEYVEAARCIGCSTMRIISKYIFPNILAPIIVQATLGIGTAIILAASLSFLGLGDPLVPEWGAMVSAARSYFRDYPHMIAFPGLAIMLSVLSLNLFGDGLRDALDPKLKK